MSVEIKINLFLKEEFSNIDAKDYSKAERFFITHNDMNNQKSGKSKYSFS